MVTLRPMSEMMELPFGENQFEDQLMSILQMTPMNVSDFWANLDKIKIKGHHLCRK